MQLASSSVTLFSGQRSHRAIPVTAVTSDPLVLTLPLVPMVPMDPWVDAAISKLKMVYLNWILLLLLFNIYCIYIYTLKIWLMHMLWKPFQVLASAYKQSHSLQFRLELCQLHVKHRMRSADQPLACAVMNGPKFSVGITTWDQATDRKSARDSPNLNPSGSKFHFMFQSGAQLPSWWTINGATTTRSKEIKSELHQLTPMTHARLCYATLLQYILLQCCCNSVNTHC